MQKISKVISAMSLLQQIGIIDLALSNIQMHISTHKRKFHGIPITYKMPTEKDTNQNLADLRMWSISYSSLGLNIDNRLINLHWNPAQQVSVWHLQMQRRICMGCKQFNLSRLQSKRFKRWRSWADFCWSLFCILQVCGVWWIMLEDRHPSAQQNGWS